jgi:hypothetical protein
MPLYRVKLVRRVPLDPIKGNPFLLAIDVLKPVPCRATYRQWEFEAKNEAEVRRWLKAAQKQRLANVLGFELESIEECVPAQGK